MNDGESSLAGLNGGVGMTYERGGDEGRGTWWKLDDQSKIPKNEVASVLGVKISKRGDRAPPLGQVALVGVRKACRLLADVEGAAREVPDGLIIRAPEGGSAGVIRPLSHRLHRLFHGVIVSPAIGGIGA